MTFLYLSFLIEATEKILFYENMSLSGGKLILVFKCGLITNIRVPSGRDSFKVVSERGCWYKKDEYEKVKDW